MDGVAVDLTDVEVLFDLGDVSGLDAVGDAPDFGVRRCWVRVAEGCPVGVFDEGDYTAGGLRSSTVVLAGGSSVRCLWVPYCIIIA